MAWKFVGVWRRRGWSPIRKTQEDHDHTWGDTRSGLPSMGLGLLKTSSTPPRLDRALLGLLVHRGIRSGTRCRVSTANPQTSKGLGVPWSSEGSANAKCSTNFGVIASIDSVRRPELARGEKERSRSICKARGGDKDTRVWDGVSRGSLPSRPCPTICLLKVSPAKASLEP